LNVKINAVDLKDHTRVLEILNAGLQLRERSEALKKEILDRVGRKID